MTFEDIKPIPKYIQNLIERQDKQDFKKPCGATRYYAYMSRFKKEIIKITVAVKHYKGKRYYKQVAVHGINAKNCFVRDMIFYFIGGYNVGWFSEGIQKYEKWYEDNNWYLADDKCFDPYAPIVNREYILKFSEYKYSAVTEYKYMDVFKYLRLYEQYPQAELLVKFGLSNLATKKQILRKVSKDKPFRKWLINNRAELSNGGVYISTILLAYKTGKQLSTTQRFIEFKKKLIADKNLEAFQIVFKNDLERIFKYLDKNNIDLGSYYDYCNACEYIGLDMTQDKNLYPHDFKRWHDIRIDEYQTAKATADEQSRPQFYAQFAKVAEKYLPLQRELHDAYIVVIARSPADLIKESYFLDHCVGRMNYDQRMLREESLIFFVRKVAEPNTPFVTVEYSLSQKKVLQCRGEKNRQPSEQVLEFVNNKWLPYANRKINKIRKMAA